MNKEEAQQAFDGVMLSDGGLLFGKGRNAHFYVGLSDNKTNLVQRELIPIDDLLGFLRYLRTDVLWPLGIQQCTGHPRIKPHATKSGNGIWLPGVYLETHCSEFLTKLHHKYYPDGRKIVPEDSLLSEISLAWFFMLDGNSQWSNQGGPLVRVTLYTQGFNLRSVGLFEERLHKLGISTGRGQVHVKEGAGIKITIPVDSSDHFMAIVDPHIISPYRYKIKYRGSCPPELAEKYRGHNNEYMREWHRKKAL